MGRQKEFDRNIIVEKAMRIFWKTGYEGTSLQMLLKGVNILNGSFYHTFKNKKNLYLEALAIYNQDFVIKRNAIFTMSGSFQTKLLYFFERVLDRQLKGECPKGCFLFNSVNTDTTNDAKIKKQLQKYIEEFELFFAVEIKQAIERGELNSKIDAETTARILVKYMSGGMQMSTLKYNDKEFRIEMQMFVELLFGKCDLRLII